MKKIILLFVLFSVFGCTGFRNTVADWISPANVRQMEQGTSFHLCKEAVVYTDISGVNEFVRLVAILVGRSCEDNSKEMRISCGADCNTSKVAREALTLKLGETFFAKSSLLNPISAQRARSVLLDVANSHKMEMIYSLNGKE